MIDNRIRNFFQLFTKLAQPNDGFYERNKKKKVQTILIDWRRPQSFSVRVKNLVDIPSTFSRDQKSRSHSGFNNTAGGGNEESPLLYSTNEKNVSDRSSTPTIMHSVIFFFLLCRAGATQIFDVFARRELVFPSPTLRTWHARSHAMIGFFQKQSFSEILNLRLIEDTLRFCFLLGSRGISFCFSHSG